MSSSQEIFDKNGDLVLILSCSTAKHKPEQESPFAQACIRTPQIGSGIFGTQPASSSPFGGASLTTHPPTTGSIFGTPPASSSGFGNTPPRVTQPASGGLFGTSSPPQSSPFFGFSTLSTLDLSTSASNLPEEASTKAEELDLLNTDGASDSFSGSLVEKANSKQRNPKSEWLSAKHMMLASPVFEAMLNGNFKEGRILQSDSRVEVPLPDDDADTFRILLNIIHGRNRSVPRKIDLDRLVQVAVLADKYQMLEAVEAYSGAWIANLKSTIPSKLCRDLGRWICISWVFGLATEFTSTTKTLIQQSEEDVPDGFMDYVPLPKVVFDDINSHRQKVIAALYDLVGQQVTSYMGPGVHCTRADNKGKTCDALVLGTLLKSATTARFWPAPPPPYTKVSFHSLHAALHRLQVESLCDSEAAYSVFGSIAPGHGMKRLFETKSTEVVMVHLPGLSIHKYKSVP